jgi:hypothetical protein
VLVIAIMLVALLIRLRGLGALGFWIDEPLTWLAAKSILDDGLARLPSGMIYTRAPLYSYVVSLFAWIGGLSEFTLRLPSVIFSLATLYVVYRFGRDLGGEIVGLLSAFILAVSPWDAHYAHIARMYAMHIFLFTLALFLIYRGYVRGHQGAKPWAIIVAVLSVLTHRQAAALAPIFLMMILFPSRSRPSLRSVIAGVIAVVVALYAVLKFVDFGISHGPTLSDINADRGSFPFPILEAIDPSLARIILYDVTRQSVWIGASAVLAIAVMCTWLLVRSMREQKSVAALIVTWAFTLALFLNQLAFAALCIMLILKLGEQDTSRALRRGILLVALCVIASAATIGAAAIAHGLPTVTQPRFLYAFFAVPVPWYQLLITQFPVMGLVAFSTALVLFLRSLPEDSHQDGFFLVGSLVLPLLLMGLHAAPYFLNRYNVYLNPVFTILFTIGLVGFAYAIGRWVAGRRSTATGGLPMLSRIVAGVIILIGLFACRQADPVQAWALGGRNYGDNREALRDPDLISHFYYDLKTTGEYVRDRRGGSDVVITRDPVGLYPYLGPSDFVLRGPYYGQGQNATGQIVDVYLNIPHLDNAASFRDVLRANNDRCVWIIMSESHLEGPDVNTPDDVLSALSLLQDHRVYTGLDHLTYVLRIDPLLPRGAVGENFAGSSRGQPTGAGGTSGKHRRAEG